MAETAPALSSATLIDDAITVARAPPLTAAEQAELIEVFEVEQTVQSVEAGDYKRIALQMPDELLKHAVPVFQALRARLPLERELYVLADTTYGSCCVDEVAASHVDADLVVHYGHACLSRTSRLPVIYVLGRKSVDATHAAESLVEAAKDSMHGSVTLMTAVEYSWRAESIAEELRQRGVEVLTRTIDRTVNLFKGKAKADESCGCSSSGCRVEIEHIKPQQATSPVIFYVGEESLALNNILLSHASSTIFVYSPDQRSARLESIRTNKMLMRRYAVVQKAKDADVFGLVVGTLGVASYLTLLDRLRSLLRRHHKKVYTLAVGKLNPAKLANYLEVECFVLVACPENSLIDGNGKDYHRPIITPFELEVALGEREWSGEAYDLDFARLLLDREETPVRETSEDEDMPVFSAATGKLRTVKRYGGKSTTLAGRELALRNDRLEVATAMDSAAGQHLAGRTYTGLDPRFGADGPASLEVGRTGIARQYDL